MNEDSKRLFRAIFHEAQPIDFDFSEWDSRVRLVVISWLEKRFPGRGPLHNVDFIDVQSFLWKSNHLGIKLHSAQERFQWHILDSTLHRKNGFYSIRLRSLGPGPDLEIECRDVALSKLNRTTVQTICPDWGEPDKPLARPGFKELCHLIRRKTRKGCKGVTR